MAAIGTYKRKALGAAPLCPTCKLREADSHRPGSLCKPCTALAFARRRAMIEQATRVAAALYETGKSRFKPCFEFIKSSAKKRERADLILAAMKSLYQRETGAEWGPNLEPRTQNLELKPRPVVDVRQYLGGTLRKLNQEREAITVRDGRGGERYIKNILEQFIEAAEKVVNAKRDNHSVRRGRAGHSCDKADRVGDRDSDRPGPSAHHHRLDQGRGHQSAGDRPSARPAPRAARKKRRVKVLPDAAGDQGSLL